MSSKQRVVVIGNGMVGHHFIEQLIQQKESTVELDITVLSGEKRLAYDRVHLSEFFQGKTAADLALTNEQCYQQWQVKFQLDAKVTHIDRTAKIVTTHAGDSFAYDKLILATGSFPFVPPIPGKDRKHCLVYRTIEDLEAISASAKSSKVGVVIGGGLLGLEAANALKQLGLQTHVVEFAPQLMGVQVDVGGGRLLKQKIEQLGVQVHTSKATQVIEDGESCRYKMCFQGGDSLETDIILFSAGIRPYDNLAREFDLAIGERGGIVINDHCQTSDDNIYAIGECALWQNFIFGLVAPGYAMAKVAAKHILNNTSSTCFTGADMSTKLKLMGVEVGSIGDAHAKTDQAISYTFEDQEAQIYKKIVLNPQRTRLIGAVLVGDTSDYDTFLQYHLNGLTLPEIPESLILPGAAPVELNTDDLPAEAIICACHSVSKADIYEAVAAGASDVAAISQCTKASTGCGGCAGLLKNVVAQALIAMPKSSQQPVCVHFNYTQAQLSDIICVSAIDSFEQLLNQFGNGTGCQACDYVFAQAQLTRNTTQTQIINQPNQLAQQQKDGSYAIVPRIPAGEITPTKLIKLGLIAKKYDLHSRITGGQRIDLLGAKHQQLPMIWHELVNAGFETGHAHKKAVRTVKSCVGNVWCRYGVKDSVGQAIDLENRYKALPSAQKLKIAVSGCTRECAQAQSKDIGVIATEQGWSLYIGGIGGMQPRHGDLFATDLDDHTLVKYIDRILMFYIKTAAPEQRIGSWLLALNGGLGYLQKIVIEDFLTVCHLLDTQMQQLVDNYQCDWQQALASPEVMAQFNSNLAAPVAKSSPHADKSVCPVVKPVISEVQ